MYRNRLGCLTGTGLVAALITILSIVGVALASGSEMFTAGALNAQNESGRMIGGASSHAAIQECKTCHTALWEGARMADRCLACHSEIARQMIDVAKLHGSITNRSPELACRDCHPEHRGPGAALTDLGNQAFPHDALGFSLRGHRSNAAREPFGCSDCHPGDLSDFTPDTCESCHRQLAVAFAEAHRLSFGRDCLACHDGVDRFGDDFTHSIFAFPLTGKHAAVGCTYCHLDARTVTDLQSAPQDCLSCHGSMEPHAGRFGMECGSCHSADGWSPAEFDHDLSIFKLEGRHTQLACAECHQNRVLVGTPQDCYSCHSGDDEHDGQFGPDCAACHSTNGWEGASFDHSRSGFPLTGAHVNTACERCHTNGQFTGLSPGCIACHAEPEVHAGQFGTECAACHATTAWLPARFTGDHTFPLDHGEEGTVSCTTCHPASYTAYTCYGCHEHAEAEIRSEHLEEGITDFDNCTECHADGREH